MTHMHALDRGEAWGRLLHHLSERLISLRSALPSSPGALPFRVEYDNLVGFSPIREHVSALDHVAALISADFDRADEPITRSTARRLAEEDGVDKPSAYDLVVMSNFLTTEENVKKTTDDSVKKDFRAELRQLASNLTPGGLLIVIGYPLWKEVRPHLVGVAGADARCRAHRAQGIRKADPYEPKAGAGQGDPPAEARDPGRTPQHRCSSSRSRRPPSDRPVHAVPSTHMEEPAASQERSASPPSQLCRRVIPVPGRHWWGSRTQFSPVPGPSPAGDYGCPFTGLVDVQGRGRVSWLGRLGVSA